MSPFYMGGKPATLSLPFPAPRTQGALMPKWLQYLRTFEPARLRAIYTAIVALVLALGISIPADVDAKVTALIGVVSVLLPLLQGELTRAVVTPVAAPAIVVPAPSSEPAYVPDTDPGQVAPRLTDNGPKPGDQVAADQSPVSQADQLTAQDVTPDVTA